ncbi:hypothetical protein OF83DRAFT_853294 [Amylostereum chailletii]|nr:hypothetical protein OF83DRAFT_853294 [Amylostereum chailletii]
MQASSSKMVSMVAITSPTHTQISTKICPTTPSCPSIKITSFSFLYKPTTFHPRPCVHVHLCCRRCSERRPKTFSLYSPLLPLTPLASLVTSPHPDPPDSKSTYKPPSFLGTPLHSPTLARQPRPRPTPNHVYHKT